MKKYKFFYSGTPFSNFYQCSFIVDGITFSSSEQYMMYQKAILFNDLNIENKILANSNPTIIKSFGRKVKNYSDEIWSINRYEIVKRGVREKFKQNEKLLKNLLKYKDYEFVEASPIDRIWGIGFSEENAINNISNWGENLLGKILTELSIELRND